MLKIHPSARDDVRFEFSTDKKEIEVYIGGWFLCSVDIEDISNEAKEYLFI